jgi:centromere-localized protein 2
MPSQEAKLLSDFLLAPAALRDFVTLRQFTDIFPKGHRTNPAVQDLYRELQRLREKDVDLVRRAIAEEITRSKRLRREYASERRQLDEATVAGLDPNALRMEEEVSDSPGSGIYYAANSAPAFESWPQETAHAPICPFQHRRSVRKSRVTDR